MSLPSSALASPVATLPYVEADLTYLIPMEEKPFNYTYEPPAGIPRFNGKFATHRIRIHNARHRIGDLSLDQQGFRLVEHYSKVNNFYDEAEVRGVYYPEAERLLQAVTGGTQVIVFDHNVRNIERAQRGESNAKEPVRRIHNDFTDKSGYSRARSELSARNIKDPESLLKQRFAVINVWRPITDPVQDAPLAICDASSIAPNDWVASDLIYPNRVGETFAVTYNPAHRWFYFPLQQRHEVTLIKCFDAEARVQARFTAHTAFDDPTTPPHAPSRQSIELRAFVFLPN
ncbi:MAG: CmcJ/NvfI family oxidoreductase [Cyanobacteriota bacterium]|nr:CmcJ/NvfI family oxidoreductase [Cyanobacteriota bacterium]